MHLNYTFIALCLAAGSLAAPANEASTLDRRAFTIETGNATHFSDPNPPNTCNRAGSGAATILAISPHFNVPSYCNRWVKITNTGGGLNNHGARNALLAEVTDTCLTCAEGDIALDPGAFSLLVQNRSIWGQDPPTEFSVEWHFCDADGSC